uniref:Craniofacial development protein 2-like n=1 Tax=Nicotiana tabacum TaxID=4097 RepID=A0A1S3ZVK6_TOBAC|nr:PREDICTED: uncharacterized protein LOC107790939 [Nicotiana tabacum]
MVAAPVSTLFAKPAKGGGYHQLKIRDPNILKTAFRTCREVHKQHLRIIVQTLRGKTLYGKFSKSEFWLDSVRNDDFWWRARRARANSEEQPEGGDFNGHIGETAGGYDKVHGGFDFGERNEGGTSLMDFAKAFGLVIANSSFPKREEHLVTFQIAVAKTPIDYLLLRRCGRGLCKDCKVIPCEILLT